MRGEGCYFARKETRPMMSDYYEILFLITGVLFGALGCYGWIRLRGMMTATEAEDLQSKLEATRQKAAGLEERNHQLSDRLTHQQRSAEQRERMLETRLEQQRNEKERVTTEYARLETEYRNLKEKLSGQQAELKEMQVQFREQFENLANRILEEKSKKFAEQNQENLGQLLQPLGKKLEEFKSRVEETHKEDIKGRATLEQHLNQLQELNQQMSDEARNLTSALKGDTKTQGSWGEMILERILEKSGLTKGREYEIQESFTTDEGRRLQPDVVIHLPDEKYLIIDSKVSLTHYEQFISAENEEGQSRALSAHIRSMRNHVRGLAEKNYQKLMGSRSPDFVLLFVPVESAFGVAIQHDTDLYYEAFERNIVIVSPSTLLATLATIHTVWKQEYQTKNAMEIAERGGALFDKFVLFAESMESVGQRIQQTQQSYDEAMNRLKTGRGSLVRQAEMLQELGVSATKTLPNTLKSNQGEEE